MSTVQFFYKLACMPGQFTRGETEKTNTCNGWGFGGWYGKVHWFTWNGRSYILRDGKAPTRFGEVFKVWLVVDANNKYATWTPKNFLKNAAEGLTPGAE